MNVLLRDSRLGIHNPERMAVTAYARDAGSQPQGCVPHPGENSSPAFSV
jgi:hypothetical protein